MLHSDTLTPRTDSFYCFTPIHSDSHRVSSFHWMMILPFTSVIFETLCPLVASPIYCRWRCSPTQTVSVTYVPLNPFTSLVRTFNICLYSAHMPPPPFMFSSSLFPLCLCCRLSPEPRAQLQTTLGQERPHSRWVQRYLPSYHRGRLTPPQRQTTCLHPPICPTVRST